ncbi:photosynthetic complex assembly protein PuhC [Salinisphaera sp. Q1T1-3]|uniref:photosynthetic complex assembly protein PuhC n=1 Tax=Salinisphaera sp. Q1T1-3 TaxID=2321229 RepID=UPI000E71D265|nr:photosynthetic complex assembly protein PuhC [Salinisphaera sp. Q1T1-3]RJS92085.1 phosphonate-binding protein [Salinisphaera sp. Q1T1-3]
MADREYRDNFPKGALIGGAILLIVTLVFVATVRLADVAPAAQVPATTDAVKSRYLKFADADNGDVIVTAVDGAGGPQHIATLTPGTNGFLRAVMRGLVQARKIDDIGPSVPFKLSRLADGRLVLADPATHRRIYLRAFGPTNAAAFGRLLDDQPMGDADPQVARAQSTSHSP